MPLAERRGIPTPRGSAVKGGDLAPPFWIIFPAVASDGAALLRSPRSELLLF